MRKLKLLAFLLLVLHVASFAQTQKWNRIDSISAQTEMSAAGDDDLFLIQDVSEGITKRSIKKSSLLADEMKLLFDYNNTDSLLNNQDVQISGQIYQVGTIFYKYNGLATGSIDDYFPVGGTISGGIGTANLYFTSDISETVPAYNQISYEFDPVEEEVAVVVQASTSPVYFQTYIFDDDIATTEIPAGNWSITLSAKVSANGAITTLGGDIFVRHTNGTETTLFSVETPDINDETDFERIIIESAQPEYDVLSTDRLGIRAFSTTTRVPSTTVTALIGGSYGAYMNTTLSLRHSSTRDKNGENAFQHVTLTERTQITTNNDSIALLNDSTVVLREDVNAIENSFANKSTQTLTETAGAVAWDYALGAGAEVTIDETTIITLTNVEDGDKGNIAIKQGDPGDNNVTFVLAGVTVRWRGDDTDLTDELDAVDVVSFWRSGNYLNVTLGRGYINQ